MAASAAKHHPARKEAALASPYRHIDDLIKEADERELVSQLTPHRETRLKNELRADEIRNRVATLKERLAKLTRAPAGATRKQGGNHGRPHEET